MSAFKLAKLPSLRRLYGGTRGGGGGGGGRRNKKPPRSLKTQVQTWQITKLNVFFQVKYTDFP